MASMSEARQERAIAALQAASRLYEGKDGTAQMYPRHVLSAADTFLEWLEKKS